jgi:hypothetical protein
MVVVLLALLLAGLGAPPARAASVRYAAPTTQGSGDCSSWANACTLQTALSGAASGDQIWVKQGVHKPGLATNRTATFTLKSAVEVYGGFVGTETALSQRNPATYRTILSGDIDDNDINTDGNNIAETAADIQGNNSYHVVTGNGTNATAVLDGVVITAGQANDTSAPNNAGGGMYTNAGSPTLMNVTFSGNSGNSGGGMYNVSSSPTLTNVTFSGNSAGSGGGMFNALGSSPTLTNVTLSSNTATSTGGGMHNAGSSPTLTDVTFSSNTATATGGGMHNASSSPTLTDVTFSGNSAGSGGGMFNTSSNPTLTNVVFSGNQAIATSSFGGGMFNVSSSSPTLTNVTFSGNSAANGGGMYNGSSPTLRNVIIAKSVSGGDCQGTVTAGSASNLIEDSTNACGLTHGTNNNIIGQDPRFVDADGADNTVGTADDNLRLLVTSPAIDAGDNGFVPSSVTTDLAGNPRIVDGNGDSTETVDMGAYELSDTIAPTVTSITRASPNPTNAASVQFTVTFAEAVTGVDAADFSLATTGSLSGASVTGVSGTGANYTVTVATGSGSGTLRLDLNASGTGIQDLVGNPISGGYTTGEGYTIDKTAPTVSFLLRASPNPTNAASVQFVVIFSESVTGVDAADFSLATTGSLSGASVTGVSGAGASYTVTVATGSGSGTLRLDLNASGTGIQDLVGNPISSGYTTGEVYTITETTAVFLPLVIR